MITFGISGSIAVGKSTVSKMLYDLYNIPIIDADLIARQVVTPGKPALTYLVNAFNSSILNLDGTLNRNYLRDLVLLDQKYLDKLNRIMFPIISEEIYKRTQILYNQGYPILGVDSALMIETGSYNLYKPLIIISCSKEIQIKRLITRNNFNYQVACNLISKQLSSLEKEKYADFIINNDNGLAELASQVYSVVFKLKQL